MGNWDLGVAGSVSRAMFDGGVIFQIIIYLGCYKLLASKNVFITHRLLL